MLFVMYVKLIGLNILRIILIVINIQMLLKIKKKEQIK